MSPMGCQMAAHRRKKCPVSAYPQTLAGPRTPNTMNETTEMRMGATKPCPLCGEPLTMNATECTKCDWVKGYRQQAESLYHHDPRDILAAVLSIAPGAGHILKGYNGLGWLLLLLGVPVICTFAFAFTMFLGWLLVPTYWIAVAADAYLRRDLKRPTWLSNALSP